MTSISRFLSLTSLNFSSSKTFSRSFSANVFIASVDTQRLEVAAGKTSTPHMQQRLGNRGVPFAYFWPLISLKAIDWYRDYF